MTNQPPPAQPVILLVDDDPRALLATAGHLQSDAYELITAHSGAQALARLREPREFALVLLDARMPIMDGFAVARAIKAEERHALLPICFLTASLEGVSAQLQAYDAGVVDVLAKPVDPHLLRAKVTVFVDLWQKTHALSAANQALQEEVGRRKTVETELRDALAEKTTLLMEIHHRVKNNLQMVMSLITMQRRRLSEPALLLALEQTNTRISAMAMIHERLYSGKSLAHIDCDAYLRDLASGLIASFARGDIRQAFELQALKLSIDQVVPLGLMVTELVTNVLKYGIGARQQGLLQLTFKRLEDGRCELVVADDGPGLPPGFDLAGATSLGLPLVQALARQLRGEASFAPAPGFTFRCVFAPL